MTETRTPRTAWLFYLVVGLILAALPAGYFYFLRDEAPPPPPPPLITQEIGSRDAGLPEPAKPLELRLGKVGGRVEVRQKDGTWQSAAPAQVLKASDAVRTGNEEGSYAVLVGGEAYEVQMRPGTELSVEALTDTISRVMLESGVATANVHGHGRHVFEVSARKSDAVARTGEGAFAISNNGGTVAVGTKEGEVQLSGGGKMVIVRAGQKATVLPGQAPSEPSPIPTSLMLKVNWPSPRQRHQEFVITGTTEPGAVVRVGNQVLPVAADGSFGGTVKTPGDGTHSLSVKAVAIGDRSTEDNATIEVKSKVKNLHVDSPDWR